ncbi:PREDICTED: LOW QUALITY PROTEIN: uncharacterized protein LOC105361959 [Ceratosolen solmsi marchali]|uniref:LOW QUALITY PROTEIN: uncharacterized protein LOC105361959 n=1 Tax=Ceratosolen solmsi marchali TaxID=326594 RepID=A0AAJ7DV59_9HYME|nr:PREDICTED: LOW QUALITY PROTEIN: uncharacterized protein LOC105361959 [Ceratosolen solmsi marchali]
MVLVYPKYSLILGLLMGLAIADILTLEGQRPESPETPRSRRICNFDEDTRTYNIADLLLCMNDLATMIIAQQNANYNKIIWSRIDEEARQSHPIPHYPRVFDGASSSNHYITETIASLLTGGLPLPSLPNLFDLASFTRPGNNLFGALSSIARYDDLKCIPRILCEVASGSTPGSLAYRQTSASPSFGPSTLFWLLTAVDLSGSSPILTFGRAALIGYANRGRPYSCYREYPRCPQNPEQLILYLNNYNGGFFRFFNSHSGNYYRPSQFPYYPFSKSSGNIENFMISFDETSSELQTNTSFQIYGIRMCNQAPDTFPQVYLGPEADRTGTGKLTLDNSNHYEEKNEDTNNILSTKIKKSESNKIVFPTNKQENDSQLYRIVKSFNTFNDLSMDHNSKMDSSHRDHKFSDEEYIRENDNIKYVDRINYDEKPYLESHEYENRNPYFTQDNYYEDTSVFTFPNN